MQCNYSNFFIKIWDYETEQFANLIIRISTVPVSRAIQVCCLSITEIIWLTSSFFKVCFSIIFAHCLQFSLFMKRTLFVNKLLSFITVNILYSTKGTAPNREKGRKILYETQISQWLYELKFVVCRHQLLITNLTNSYTYVQ